MTKLTKSEIKLIKECLVFTLSYVCRSPCVKSPEEAKFIKRLNRFNKKFGVEKQRTPYFLPDLEIRDNKP